MGSSMRFFSILPGWEREPSTTELSFKQEGDERLMSSYLPTKTPMNKTPMNKRSVFLYGEKTAYMIQDSYSSSALRFQFYDDFEVSRIRRDLVLYVVFRAAEERKKPAGKQTWEYDDVCDIVDTSSNEPFKIAVETRYYYKYTALCRLIYLNNLNNSPQFLL
jgi:hypothetical protein